MQSDHIAQSLPVFDEAIDIYRRMLPHNHPLHALAGDWVIDIGPDAGDEGGRVVAFGTPADLSRTTVNRTAPYLRRVLTDAPRS